MAIIVSVSAQEVHGDVQITEIQREFLNTLHFHSRLLRAMSRDASAEPLHILCPVSPVPQLPYSSPTMLYKSFLRSGTMLCPSFYS